MKQLVKKKDCGDRMVQIKAIKKNYADLVINIILATGCILGTFHNFPFEADWFFFGMMILLLNSLIVCVDTYKKIPLTYGILMTIIIIIGLLCRQNEWSISNLVKETYEWSMSYDGTMENYNPLYAKLWISEIILGISMVCYIGNKLQIIKAIFTITIVVILGVMSIYEIEISKLGLLCLIAYVMLEVIGLGHRKCYKDDKDREETWKVTYTLVPVILATTLLVSLLPSRKEPISWKWVSNIYHSVESSVRDLFSEITYRMSGEGDEFGLNFFGTDQTSTLGGNVKSSDEVLLIANSMLKPHHPVYIAGNYKEIYTGNSWETEIKDKPSELEGYKLDTYELLYGLSLGALEQEGEPLVKENTLKLTYGKIRSKTLFIPSKMNYISDMGRNSKPIFKKTGASLKSRAKKGTTYKTNFLELNTESDFFKQKMEDMSSFSYDMATPIDNRELISELRSIVNVNILKQMIQEEDVLNQLALRSQSIKQNYTALPENLPSRIKELTLTITEGCNDPYEKVKAIESYLRSHYQYTKSPGLLPEGEDFVDYFLFENPSGYCTYFASALAVMARTIDIPTRYVEGFIIDYSDIHKTTDNIEIKGDKAHAWVEAYFEGMGWIRLEPSAGFEPKCYYDWRPKPVVKLDAPVMMPEIPEIPESEPVVIEEIKDTQSAQEIKSIAILMGKILLCIIVFVGSMSNLQMYLYRRKFSNSVPLTQLKLAFGEAIFALGKMGYGMGMGETLEQFKERLTESPINDVDQIEKMIEAYSEARYGNAKWQIENQQTELYQDFWIKLQKNHGRFKASWWRFSYRIYGYRKLIES